MEHRAADATGCSPVKVVDSAHWETAWRLVKGRCPTKARATGEVKETALTFRTLPVIVTAVLARTTGGVTDVTETVKGVDLVDVAAGATVVVPDAGAWGAGAVEVGAVEVDPAEVGAVEVSGIEMGGVDIARSGTSANASRAAVVVRRHTRKEVLRPVTSRPPGAPTRPGLSAVRWGR
ncbi:MAG: hypothetical protein QOF35_1757 [Actinomycetota bacterium]|nr:hypothetical protein [Actinomycetota bacterium]